MSVGTQGEAGPDQGDGFAADSRLLSTDKRSATWWLGLLIVLVLVWGSLAGLDLFLFKSRSTQASAAKATATPQASAPSPSTHPNPTARPSAGPARPAQSLIAVAASALGPAGPGSGDNSADAYKAIDASAATAWRTSWYRSAEFGNLKTGTGLLIDMGHPERIATVWLALGSAPGADLQVLTGDSPDRATMHLEAASHGAGGTVRLVMATHRRARYLLIWFTLLPPDSAGTYRASVYNVRIEGRP